MHTYPYFDSHCDTLSQIAFHNKHLTDSNLRVNLKNLRTYRYAVQVFALFNEGNLSGEDIVKALHKFRMECNRHSGAIGIQCSTLGIRRNFARRRSTAILAIEGLGNQTDFSPEWVGRLYRQGVRFMSLGWNNDNILCGGSDSNAKGITPLGVRTLEAMEKLKVILDVSHMSDKSFEQALSHYKLPICATHSGSRSVHPSPRNLTDSQFRELASRGGVCSVYIYPPLIAKGECTIKDIVAHIEHFMSLGGEDNIGIGADFDGIDTVPSEVENSSLVYRIFDTLLSLNYKESTVKKIAFTNLYNLMTKFEF